MLAILITNVFLSCSETRDFATCGSSDEFCNASQYQCEKSCEGHWIERVIEPTYPPECIPLWGECEPGSGGYYAGKEQAPPPCCPIEEKDPSGGGYGGGGYPICHTYPPGDYSQCIPDDHQGTKDSYSHGDVALEWNRVALQANILDHNGPIGSGGGGRKLYWGYEDLLSGGYGPAPTQGPPGSARALASESFTSWTIIN